MRGALSLRHVACLAVVVLRWGAWLSLNADVVVVTDGDTGGSRPTHTHIHTQMSGMPGGGHFISVVLVSRRHLLVESVRNWRIMTLSYRKQPSLFIFV